MSDAVPSRTKRDANPRRPVSAFVKQEVGLEPIAQSPISEVSHRSPRYSRPEAIELRPGPGPTKQETRVLNTPPSKSVTLTYADMLTINTDIRVGKTVLEDFFLWIALTLGLLE